MSNKYLKLSFKNAKLFPKNIKTKDFIRCLDVNKKGELYFSRQKRAESETANFIEAITVHQISNMLHTLIGERPVPSFRQTFYQRNEEIFNLASNSLLKINTPKTTKKTKDEVYEVYVDEFMRVNKSANDSWSDVPTIQWFKIRKYLGENFDEFIEMINKSLGYDVLSEPFENLRMSYNKYGCKLDEVIEYVKSKKKKPIADFLTSDKFGVYLITNTIKCGLGETIISGIDVVHVLDGEVLVPYDESFVNKLVKNSTNILDGGYVKITDVLYDDEIYNVDEFKPVSLISDKKH